MAKSIWFRRTIQLGDSLIVVIPAELCKLWNVQVGEQMCWRRDKTIVTFKPSRLAVQRDKDAEAELEKLKRKEAKKE